jgi:hypothetical protein
LPGPRATAPGRAGASAPDQSEQLWIAVSRVRAPQFAWRAHASSLRSLDTVPRSWYDSVRPRRSFTYLSQASIRRSAPISGHGDVRLRVWPVGFLHGVSHLEPQRVAHRWNGSDPSLPGAGGSRAVAGASTCDSGRPCAIPDNSRSWRFAPRGDHPQQRQRHRRVLEEAQAA